MCFCVPDKCKKPKVDCSLELQSSINVLKYMQIAYITVYQYKEGCSNSFSSLIWCLQIEICFWHSQEITLFVWHGKKRITVIFSCFTALCRRRKIIACFHRNMEMMGELSAALWIATWHTLEHCHITAFATNQVPCEPLGTALQREGNYHWFVCECRQQQLE